MSAMLIDTDVLNDYLRGLEQAQNFIASLPEQVYISAITVAELHVGYATVKNAPHSLNFWIQWKRLHWMLN